MASIKVSELPAVAAITPSDVLIINDENAVTSSINIANFTTSFVSQNLAFTGTVDFAAATTFLVGSTPVFQSDTVFNERVTFNGPLTLGSLADIPLGSLSDVSIPTTPVNGNLLTWNAAGNTWTNQAPIFSNLSQDTSPTLGASLNCNGFNITSGSSNVGPGVKNVTLDPFEAGVVILTGNLVRGAGQIVLNCEQNTHGVTFRGPTHSAAADYTFILPASMGTSGQVLTTNGTDQTSWTTLTAASVGAATAAQGVLAEEAMRVDGTNTIPAFADDSAAAGGGVPVGGLYRIANAVQVRLV